MLNKSKYILFNRLKFSIRKFSQFINHPTNNTTTPDDQSGLLIHQNTNCINILRTDNTDILYNLAVEEYLFEHMTLVSPLLFLWRNDKTIVIGKHQNPWKECHIQKMEHDGVVLSRYSVTNNPYRRKTGGGAVYHDLGNTCFTFLNPILDLQKTNFKIMNNEVLINALKHFDVNAQASGRNDIEVHGKKISGSAYRLKLGKQDGEDRKALHHGTLMINVDKAAILRYLNPNKLKLISKGVDSVQSRVINLQEINPEITHEKLSEQVCTEFKRKYSDLKVYERVLEQRDLDKIDKIREIHERNKEWDWRYGETPHFNHNIEYKFDWGLVDLYVTAEKGVITEGRMFSDCLFPEFIDQFNFELNKKHHRYDQHGVRILCKAIRTHYHGNEQFTGFINDIERWFIESL